MKVSSIQWNNYKKSKDESYIKNNSLYRVAFDSNFKNNHNQISKHNQSLKTFDKLESLKKLLANIVNNNEKEKFVQFFLELQNYIAEISGNWLFSNITLPINFFHTISNLNKEVLNKIMDKINDDDDKSRVVKKEFLNLLVNSGYYINNEFVKIFRELPDNLYGSFKEEIIEKVLYIVSDKNIDKKSLDFYHYNYLIINSINDLEHEKFLQQNKDRINSFNKEFENYIISDITNEKDNIYFLYLNNFQDNTGLANIKHKIFKKILKENDFNIQDLSKKLNTNEFYIEILLKIENLEKQIPKVNDKDEKLRKYIELIDEVLSKNFPIKKFYGEAYLDKKNTIKRIFLNSGELKPELYEKYDKYLDYLDLEYEKNKNIYRLNDLIINSKEGYELS